MFHAFMPRLRIGEKSLEEHLGRRWLDVFWGPHFDEVTEFLDFENLGKYVCIYIYI